MLKIKIPVDGRGIPARPAKDSRRNGRDRKAKAPKGQKKADGQTSGEAFDAPVANAQAPAQQKPRPKRHFHRRHKGKNPKGGATATSEA